MSELFDKSIRTLELPAVLNMLSEQTNSAESREKALAIVPQTDVDDVKRLQDELDIAGVLRCARRVRDYFNDDGQKTAIDYLFYALRGNRFLEDKIFTSILEEDVIADNASPELADIRRHIRVAASKGRQILQKIISSQSYSNHPAGRTLRGTGKGGVPGQYAGAGPRRILQRGHHLCGAHGGGTGQQRTERAGG